MATLTLIIDYLFTQMNMMYPLFGDSRIGIDTSQFKYLDNMILNLTRYEYKYKNKIITSLENLTELLNNFFRNDETYLKAMNIHFKTPTNVLKNINTEESEGIVSYVNGLIQNVIDNPEEAKKFIKGEWVKGYEGIEADLLDKDGELRDDVNMYDLRNSYYETAKLKIDELNEQKRKLNSNASNEDYSKIINAIREIKKTYNFQISAGYAVLEYDMKYQYWPDDIKRVRGILYDEDDKRYKVSPTSGGRRRRSKSRKSQRKTKKSRKTKQTKKTRKN